MKKGFRKLKLAVYASYWKLPFLWKKRPDATAVPSAYGIWLSPNPDDMTFQLYVSGRYGRYFLKYLKSQAKPFVFLDIGANQGLYSVLAAQNHNCTHVFAFEPVGETADLLDRNLTLNNCKNVRVCRTAISDFSGVSSINRESSHSGKATLREDVLASPQTASVEVMNASDLSSLIPESETRIIAKVDVEGHELTVLRELLKTNFAGRICAIFYECDTRWVEPLEIQNLLSQSSFESFEKIGDGTHYDVLATR